MDYKKRSDDVTVILGDEYDGVLRTKLIEVLKQCGAISSGAVNKFLAGSQEIEELTVNIDGCLVHIEAETYVGLSVSGPLNIVKRIEEMIHGKKVNTI